MDLFIASTTFGEWAVSVIYANLDGSARITVLLGLLQVGTRLASGSSAHSVMKAMTKGNSKRIAAGKSQVLAVHYIMSTNIL